MSTIPCHLSEEQYDSMPATSFTEMCLFLNELHKIVIFKWILELGMCMKCNLTNIQSDKGIVGYLSREYILVINLAIVKVIAHAEESPEAGI